VFSVTVRDRTMVAHSLAGEFFGPAQRVHGATYLVEVTVAAEALDSHHVVLDIGALSRELRAVLSDLDHRNLDDEPAFAGLTTTTEVLARVVADRVAERIAAGALGREVDHLTDLEVTLHESDVARAGYRRAVRGRA
jgi:6-pyruvoyl-tetrahydropterin synthase